MFDEMFEHLLQSGMDPAYVEAWRSLGYIVTEDNQHLFTAHEVEAWRAKVDEFWGDDEANDLSDDEELSDWSEFFEDTAHSLELVVAQTLADGGDEEPALRLTDACLSTMSDDDGGDDDGGIVFTSLLATLMAWLVGAREAEVDAEATLSWVSKTLSKEAFEASSVLSGLLDHPQAPEVTVDEVHEQLGPLMLPAMIWLAAGVAATAGAGKTAWLRQFDLKQ